MVNKSKLTQPQATGPKSSGDPPVKMYPNSQWPPTPPTVTLICSICRIPVFPPPPGRSNYVYCYSCHNYNTHVAPYPPYCSQNAPPPPLHLPSHQSAFNVPYIVEPSVSLPWIVPIERKKAVICGISYKGTAKGTVKELKGCINDAKSMKFLLVNTFNFPEPNIRMLTDEEGTHPSLLPTKENIISSLRWLVDGCQAGDSLVFHFAGHGVQKRDKDEDEKDGFDEALVPLDFSRYGEIVDDVINKIIVNPLPTGVRLHAIVDACHSGTILDLEWLWNMKNSGSYYWEDHRPKNGAIKGTKGGEVFAFSGCDDDQDAGNAPAWASPSSAGAMTFAFIQTIKLDQSRTYGELLTNMRMVMKNMNDLPNAEIPTRKNKPLVQDPQLSSNKSFDVYKKEFKL